MGALRARSPNAPTSYSVHTRQTIYMYTNSCAQLRTRLIFCVYISRLRPIHTGRPPGRSKRSSLTMSHQNNPSRTPPPYKGNCGPKSRNCQSDIVININNSAERYQSSARMCTNYVNPVDSPGRLWVCCPVSCGPMVRVMVASLVSVALALVGASETLDKCYDSDDRSTRDTRHSRPTNDQVYIST